MGVGVAELRDLGRREGIGEVRHLIGRVGVVHRRRQMRRRRGGAGRGVHHQAAGHRALGQEAIRPVLHAAIALEPEDGLMHHLGHVVGADVFRHVGKHLAGLGDVEAGRRRPLRKQQGQLAEGIGGAADLLDPRAPVASIGPGAATVAVAGLVPAALAIGHERLWARTGGVVERRPDAIERRPPAERVGHHALIDLALVAGEGDAVDVVGRAGHTETAVERNAPAVMVFAHGHGAGDIAPGTRRNEDRIGHPEPGNAQAIGARLGRHELAVVQPIDVGAGAVALIQPRDLAGASAGQPVGIRRHPHGGHLAGPGGAGILHCGKRVRRRDGGDLDGHMRQAARPAAIAAHVDQPQLGADRKAVVAIGLELGRIADADRGEVEDLFRVGTVVGNHALGIGIAAEDVVDPEPEPFLGLVGRDAQCDRKRPADGDAVAINDFKLFQMAIIDRALVRCPRPPQRQIAELAGVVGTMTHAADMDRLRARRRGRRT